ncbi:gene transfer agent family protein [Methylobacterium aquaticum]|uniref:Gene transfer agent family protein n=1 Tax=Methylobacterium aquaticum TaxID=270351 RepID=A0A0C6EWH9_9HYPH|nr:gene transfer agent family protein [Methylobacterium aquaticum]BAQ44401.1 hypothetical protein Maq22A_c05050 [Methylobacterium aquaticum]
MARRTSIDLPFGDAEHHFHLDIPRLKQLQEKCNAGPPEILARLADGRARVEDAQETIRLGLIGGGMPAQQALKLIQDYAGDDTPLVEVIATALMVLAAAVFGNPPPPPVPKEGGDEGNREAATS